VESKCKKCAYIDKLTGDYPKDSISCGECKDRHDRDVDVSNYEQRAEVQNETDAKYKF
jgi:hypothetical protein